MITIIRVILLFTAVGLILKGEWVLSLSACGLIALVIVLDWADGYVARKMNATTPAGAVMDIVADRIVENVLWIIFAYAGVVPLWVPLVVLVRGIMTDAVRSVALSQGRTAFGPQTMMRTPLGQALVSSKMSRSLYAVMKAVTFCVLALYLAAVQAFHAGVDAAWVSASVRPLAAGGILLTLGTVSFCILRGAPVLIEGWRLIRSGVPPEGPTPPLP